MMSMGSKLRKSKPLTEEQIKFIQQMKEQKEKQLKEKARQDFLSKHKFIEIKSEKEAIKVLKELNKKCGGCSKLLNKDELKLKCKLENQIQKNELKIWEVKNENTKRNQN